MKFELPPKKKEVCVDLGQIMEDFDLEIMQHIGSTEPSTFFELCNSLRTHNLCPVKGDKAGWSSLFKTLHKFVADGDAVATKSGSNIQTIQLTKQGADKVREFADRNRMLLNLADKNSEIEEVMFEESYGRFNEHCDFE